MRAWPAALALVAGAGVCAGTANLPTPGSEQKAIDLSAYACVQGPTERVCRRAQGASTLYGVTLVASVISLREGRLMRVSAVFEETAFNAFRRAMRAELGPGEEGTEQLKAGMGGTFGNRFEVWRRDGQVLLLEQYFERVMNSALTTMTDAEFERLRAQRQSQRVRGARDL